MNCHQNIKSSSFYFSFQFGEDSETFWLWISLMMFQMCWNVNNSTWNSFITNINQNCFWTKLISDETEQFDPQQDGMLWYTQFFVILFSLFYFLHSPFCVLSIYLFLFFISSFSLSSILFFPFPLLLFYLYVFLSFQFFSFCLLSFPFDSFSILWFVFCLIISFCYSFFLLSSSYFFHIKMFR